MLEKFASVYFQKNLKARDALSHPAPFGQSQATHSFLQKLCGYRCSFLYSLSLLPLWQHVQDTFAPLSVQACRQMFFGAIIPVDKGTRAPA